MNRYQKWVDLGIVLAALALGFLFHQMLSQVWEIFRLPLMSGWPVQLPTILGVVVGVIAFLVTRTNAKAMAFLNDVANELSKVTWPTRQETVASTGVIIVMVGIAALIMLGADFIWGSATIEFFDLTT